MSAKYTTEVTLQIAVRDLADMFVNLTSDDQADFFERVGFCMKGWAAHERDMQMLYIAKELRGGLGAAWVATLAEELSALSQKPSGAEPKGEGDE